jgi:catechol 2,3-dioxygenase-like lactoylglutathione lyase family enzyme
MKPRLDHIGLDVSDYEASKAFYESALAPLAMRVVMEPVPEVGGFGEDFPFFWIGRRGRGPDSGVHVAFTAADRATVDAFHAAALGAGGTDNGGPGLREIYHTELLRSLRARSGRKQRRGRLPQPGIDASGGPSTLNLLKTSASLDRTETEVYRCPRWWPDGGGAQWIVGRRARPRLRQP